MPRPLVVLDLEATGLDHDEHITTEIAWWNLMTGEQDSFIPAHDVRAALAGASIPALQMTKYVDRIALAPQDNGDKVSRLHDELSLHDAPELKGATILGANPRFDVGFLERVFTRQLPKLKPQPWHYRLLDIETYAMAVLGLGFVPGLHFICDALELPESQRPDHSAEGDVRATGHAFLRLQGINAARIRMAP